MTDFVGSPSESERLRLQTLVYKAIAKAVSCNLRVALPGVIQSFDAATQTAKIDLAIKDRIVINKVRQDIQIPTLLDVPIVLPRAGGFVLTMPIKAGDECLVIFADMNINQWFANGAVQNPNGSYAGQIQERLRRHNFSDAFAILGTWSQPRKLANYDTTKAQLRNDAGTVAVSVDNTEVTLEGNLALSGFPTPSSTLSDHSLPVTIGGVQYYLRLSSTP